MNLPRFGLSHRAIILAVTLVGLLVGGLAPVAGVMHTPSDLTGEALKIVRESHGGPLMAYPDSGYFEMPHWQFKDVIAPDDLHGFATGWVSDGVQVLGGCCGLSPEHIRALAPLKQGRG